MSRDLEAFKFNQIPNITSKGADNHWRNNSETLSNQTQSRAMQIVHNGFRNEKNLDGKLPTANLSFTNKVYSEPSPLKMAYRKGEDKVIDGAEKIANFGKSNFIEPYPNAQLNTIDLLFGRWIDDYETSKKNGGLIIPKFLRTSVIMSYLGKWLDTTLMPTGIPDLAFKSRNKLNNIFIPPISKVFNGIKKTYRKTRNLFYSKEGLKVFYRNKRVAKEKKQKKLITPYNKFKKLVNEKWTFRRRSTDSRKANTTKISSLAEKNKKYYDDLEDAA